MGLSINSCLCIKPGCVGLVLLRGQRLILGWVFFGALASEDFRVAKGPIDLKEVIIIADRIEII